MRKATADPALAYRAGSRTSSCSAHIVLGRTSSCGAHHPAAHIIMRRTSAHNVLWHASSCGTLHAAAHIILRRISSCNAHHPVAHFIVSRTSSYSAHPNFILRPTSSCGALHPAAHNVLRLTSSCSALHPAAHIVLRRTSSCGTSGHIVLRRTSSCGALHPAAHIIVRRTSSCGPHRPAAHFIGRAYISLAAEVGLWVILRPGPYICAEWDLGGLPSWLLQDKHMQLRTTYPGFVDAVNLYFDKLVSIIKPLMFEDGGPIIAVQVENEYGSYAKDEEYMSFIMNCLQTRGIRELLLTSDNWEGLRYGGVEGVLKTINLQRLSFGAIQHLADMQPQKPLMVMEYWSGWFDVWGEHHHVFNAEDMLAVVSEILERGVSINLYMFHGGTSFGFMNGAMDFGAYKPQVTSYDYDAPLSEAGDCTLKYQLLRNLFSQYHSEPLSEVPSPRRRRVYDPVVIQQHLSLWDSLHFTDKPHRSDLPVNMENLPVNNNNGQSFGYALYETTISNGGVLNSRNNIRDRALVFVDKQFVGSLDFKTHELTLPDGKRERTLSFLVENCGRVNYGKALDEQRK
ncbi:unnamed protein product, partial [Pleuronectes platessa]